MNKNVNKNQLLKNNILKLKEGIKFLQVTSKPSKFKTNSDLHNMKASLDNQDSSTKQAITKITIIRKFSEVDSNSKKNIKNKSTQSLQSLSSDKTDKTTFSNNKLEKKVHFYNY